MKKTNKTKAQKRRETGHHCVSIGNRYLVWRFLPGDITGVGALFPVLVDLGKVK